MSPPCYFLICLPLPPVTLKTVFPCVCFFLVFLVLFFVVFQSRSYGGYYGIKTLYHMQFKNSNVFYISSAFCQELQLSHLDSLDATLMGKIEIKLTYF